MEKQQAIDFVKKMYGAVWRPLNFKKLVDYYHANVVGHSADMQISFEDIKKHLINLSKKYRELIPDFHRILSAGNQITVWFTQHGIGFNGEELLSLETMVTYEITENKISELWFVWNVSANEFFNLQTHPEKFSKKIVMLDVYSLTKRELQVLYYLIRYFSVKEIARILRISSRTVETHIEHIKSKFQVNTIDQIIDFAISQGYAVSIPDLVDLAIKRGIIKPLG